MAIIIPIPAIILFCISFFYKIRKNIGMELEKSVKSIYYSWLSEWLRVCCVLAVWHKYFRRVCGSFLPKEIGFQL